MMTECSHGDRMRSWYARVPIGLRFFLICDVFTKFNVHCLVIYKAKDHKLIKAQTLLIFTIITYVWQLYLKYLIDKHIILNTFTFNYSIIVAFIIRLKSFLYYLPKFFLCCLLIFRYSMLINLDNEMFL